MFSIETWCEGKNSSFANFGRGSACGICKCAIVGWLPQLSRRAEAGGQKLIFSCSIFQSVLQFFSCFFDLHKQASMFVSVLHLAVTLSICKVGDCGLQTYQTVTILKRATTLEINTISPILYIHC